MEIEVNEQGTHVVAIKADGNRIPISRTPLKKIGPILVAFKMVAAVCDLSKVRFPTEEIERVPTWTEEDFVRLVGKISGRQKIFLQQTLKDAPIPTKDVVKALNDTGYPGSSPQSVSGLRSGLTKIFKKIGKAELVDQEWNKEEWQNYYRMKEQYMELARRIIGVT